MELNEETLKHLWASKPELRAEFSSFEIYKHYRMAVEKGLVPKEAQVPGKLRTKDKDFTEADYRLIWNHQPKVRAEFDSFETFMACNKAELKGLVKPWKKPAGNM